MQVVEIVEINDEGLSVPEDVVEEASTARYQMLSKKSKLMSKIWTNLGVNENQ
jgi:hypothetical protein